MRSAASLIERGDVHTLAPPLGRGQTNVGTRAEIQHHFTATTADALLGDVRSHGVAVSDDVVTLPLHSGAHVDGLCHVAHGDALYNGWWAGDVTASSGARHLGIEQLAGGLVGRGVLVDVATHARLDPFAGQIDGALLQSTMDAQGVESQPGDVLLVRTGWMRAWTAAANPPSRRSAGLIGDAVDWLAEHDVAMVAADNRMVDAVPNVDPGEPLPLHTRGICGLGLLLGELFALDELAASCHADGRFAGLFVAAPLPLVGATASPVNPLMIR